MDNPLCITGKIADLHLHSTASDGSLAPEELVRAAADAGLSAIALTDHDTVAGISLAQRAAKQAGILLIPGVEFSAVLDEEIHLLGYHINPQDEALLQTLKRLQEGRARRNIKLDRRLQELGFKISLEEAAGYAADGNVTKAHFAMAMLKRGYVLDMQEAFSRYLGEGKPAHVPRDELSARKAIDFIRGAGGIAVLAHPFQYCKQPEGIRRMLTQLKPLGLMGMECYYGAYDEAQTALLLEDAKEFGLIATGGSDFHGDFRPGLKVGSAYGKLHVPYDVVINLERAKNKNI